MFHKAVRTDVKLRIGLAGPSGSGKTYSALRIAQALAKVTPTRGSGAGRVAVLDTERDSAQLYAGEDTTDGILDFDVAVLADYRAETFTKAIEAAKRAGYPVIVIDSLSHAWEGILELKDATGKSFDAWKTVTPVHNKLVDMILRYPGHVVACARVKTEYVVEQTENRQGRTVSAPKKVGLAPVARAGMEYEFTVFGDLEPGTNTLTISKTRCSALQGRTWVKPGADFAQVLIDWLASAEAAKPVDAQDEGEAGGSEPEEPEAAPAKAAHHASWTDAERNTVAGLLDAAGGYTIPQASAALEAVKKPRLTAMDPAMRSKALAWLLDGAGRAHLDTWLATPIGRAVTLDERVGETRAAKARAAAGLAPKARLATLGEAKLTALLVELEKHADELEAKALARFVKDLEAAGLALANVSAWALGQGLADPVTMSSASRKLLLADLTGEGRQAFNDWLDGHLADGAA